MNGSDRSDLIDSECFMARNIFFHAKRCAFQYNLERGTKKEPGCGCPGAARATGSEIIQTESQSTQLCADDNVRIYDPVEAQAAGPGSFARCRLGVFTAVPR